MSSYSSDSVALDLLRAIARECRVMADEIALLGGQVSSGTAGVTALQTFDFLTQHASAQAMLVEHLAQIADGPQALDDVCDLIGTIPLPRVRARMMEGLRGPLPSSVNDDDTIIWMDG